MQNEQTRLPYRNPVLTDGLIAAPLAVFADSFQTALMAAYVFAFVMIFAVPMTAMIPRKLPLSVRILVYSLTCAFVYIPAVLTATVLIPDVSAGVWMPVLALTPMLTLHRDRYFGGRGAVRNLLRMIPAVGVLTLAFGAVRELLGTGMLSDQTVLHHPPLPLLCEPAGGLLLLGILCIAAVWIPGRNGKEAEQNAAG